MIGAKISTKNEDGTMVLVMAPVVKADWGKPAVVHISNHVGESVLFEVVVTKK